MRKLIILIFLFHTCCLSVYSQNSIVQWARSMGGASSEGGKSIAIDNSGNIYVVGYFQLTVDFDPGVDTSNHTSAGYDDIYLTKFDPEGNLLWSKTIGAEEVDDAIDIKIDPAGDIFITGFFGETVDFDPDSLGVYYMTASSGSLNVFILKIDSNGNFMWAGNIGGSVGLSIALKISNSGDLYLSGFFNGTYDFDPDPVIGYPLTSVSGSTDAYLLKLNNQGVFQWVKTIAGDSAGVAHAIVIDEHQNCYFAGYFNGTADLNPDASLTDSITSNGDKDIFIVKLDSLGNFIYGKGIGGATDEWAYSMACDINNNLYVTGYFTNTVDFNPDSLNVENLIAGGQQDIFILKLDSAGNFLWAKGIGGVGYDYGNNITFDNNGVGSLLLTGSFNGSVDFDPSVSGIFSLTSLGTQNIFLLRLDTDGNFRWAESFGGTLFDEGSSIAIDAAGNIFTTGFFKSSSLTFGSNLLTNYTIGGGQEDIFLAKLGVCSASFNVFPDTIPQHWFAVNQAYGSLPLTYTWDWGDGDTTVGQFPDHSYASAGLYTICLTVGDSMGCSDTFCDTSNIYRVDQSSAIISLTVIPQIITSIADIEVNGGNVVVYPNPTSDEFTIQLADEFKKADLVITDLVGKLVFSKSITETIKISSSELNLKNGIYFLSVALSDSIVQFKLVVKR